MTRVLDQAYESIQATSFFAPLSEPFTLPRVEVNQLFGGVLETSRQSRIFFDQRRRDQEEDNSRRDDSGGDGGGSERPMAPDAPAQEAPGGQEEGAIEGENAEQLAEIAPGAGEEGEGVVITLFGQTFVLPASLGLPITGDFVDLAWLQALLKAVLDGDTGLGAADAGRPRILEQQVVEINDAPTDLALSNNEIDENSALGTVVGTATATEPDAGDTHNFELLDDAGGRFATDTTGSRSVLQFVLKPVLRLQHEAFRER